ncbi:glycine cleavage system protein GcvH [Paenibacillus sp. FJAT-26967]|uniref:glycine cleavage system protein GcvH n=1 Tax=Paenibacillus sp. FJAT-26967 TaxID=1729690 RepID=UPI000838604D|nr:glycine cleavage system protein GcvH [Paenibacillus sp. FJAT-26967]
MSEVKSGLFYSKDHEWVEVLSDTQVRVGMTPFAQEQLGDIVFVELPKVGAPVKADDMLGSVESVKTVSDLISPVIGIVAETNGALEDSPELVNSEPYGAGWVAVIDITGKEAIQSLMTAEQYKAYISSES